MFSLLIAVIYMSFISLGLPDSLLGAAWPIIRAEFDVPLSYGGAVFVIISVGTIVSSLMSDFMTKKMGTGLLTAISVTTTALALFGFSISTKFYMLVLFAIPYGLGAGGVDAALNNYVALHLKSRHMSWLHCMWGVGAAVSPYIMSFALTRGSGWNQGYMIVGAIQICLSAILFISLPLWKKHARTESANADKTVCDEISSTEAEHGATSDGVTESKTLCDGAACEKPPKITVLSVLKTPGAITCFICFFCYCALEQTTMLWASSYMISHNGITEEEAAMLASLFFIGITVGRAINGFLTMKFTDKTLIRTGLVIIAVGIISVAIPAVKGLTVFGFIAIGLGCAPVYPCIIHSTPLLFGADKSQAMIGVQMASAYSGSCVAPPVFGLMANGITPKLLPYFLAVFLVLMLIMHELTVASTRKKAGQNGN